MNDNKLLKEMTDGLKLLLTTGRTNFPIEKIETELYGLQPIILSLPNVYNAKIVRQTAIYINQYFNGDETDEFLEQWLSKEEIKGLRKLAKE